MIKQMLGDSKERKNQFNSQSRTISNLRKEMVRKELVKPALNDTSLKKLSVEGSMPRLRGRTIQMGNHY